MLKVGITGGIGSGKTTVCQVFLTLGIPVFYADDAARYLMEHDPVLINDILFAFGDTVFSKGKLNRELIAAQVFQNPEKLALLNALVHPATIAYAKQWAEKQTTPYTIKEAAIFFESGSNADMDIMIGVQAPLELRISRAMQRSNYTRQNVLDRISKQMDQEEKMKRCNYVIINDEQQAIIPQVLALHKDILSISNKG